jgi:hypothetical protein
MTWVRQGMPERLTRETVKAHPQRGAEPFAQWTVQRLGLPWESAGHSENAPSEHWRSSQAPCLWLDDPL